MPFIDQWGNAVEPPCTVTSIGVDTLEFPATTDVDAVQLDFEHDQDGRPFSACAVLRSSGFSGVLLATGNIGLDRLSHAFAVGFDLVWLEPEEIPRLRPIHLRPFAHRYQHPVGISPVQSGAGS